MITTRHLAKFAATTLTTCALTAALLLASASAWSQPDHGVILLYHHVDTDTPAITSISPEDFEAQLQYLEDNDFRVWALPRLVDTLSSGQSVPDKVVVITFDDNYESVYTEAFPRLKRRDWPFTVFVSTDAVDKGINMQASWDQVREMAQHGATIANHSASHAHLLQKQSGESHKQWRERIRNDIARAQRRIEEETGQQHKLFAYPFGEYNRELVAMVEGMGYVGIGQHSGPTPADYAGLALPRFPFAGDYSDVSDFALKVLTLPLPVAEARDVDGPLSFDTKRPTLELALKPGDYRARSLQCFGSGQGALKLDWQADREVEVVPGKDLPLGRSRYNCTLPTGKTVNGTQRFYWYSHPWIRLTEDGKLLD